MLAFLKFSSINHKSEGLMIKRFLVLVMLSCVSLSVPVANAAGVVEPVSLSAALSAVSAMPSSANSTTSTTVPVKPVKKTVPVKPKNKKAASAVGKTVPVIANVSNISNISTGTSGSSGTASVVVLPVEVAGLISVCVNKSTSVLRDTADNSCSSGSEIKVEWLDTGMSPKICVNNNNREMTLAKDGNCATKNSAVADVTVNKQILACADDKTGVLRYQKTGVCGAKTDPVVWVLKAEGVARNVDSAIKKGGVEIISLIPNGAAGDSSGSIKTVTTIPTTNTSSVTTTTIAATTTVPTATLTTTSSSTTTSSTTTSSTTTTTIASRASGSFAGYLGGKCPDGSGIPWYWGKGDIARAGGCSAAASRAPTTTAPATTAAAVSATTIAPVVVPGTPATPTGVAGNTQVTVTVAAGTGGTPTSYTITQSTTSGGTYTTGCTVTGASGSCVVTGLTNGTTYFFKTTATNSAGTSSLSTASSAVTPVVTVSGAPTVGTATVASPTSATVACTSPLSNGGTTITSYTATAVGDATKTGTLTSATCTTITVSGLTTGTAYTFTVTATNTTGTSAASGASNSVTPVATVPGAPTVGTATIASATSVTVACTTPGSNGGATITTYTFISSPGGVTATLTSATCSATTVTGLTTNTAYTFTVKATNSAGASSASAASTSVTPGATCATYGICIVGNTGPGGGTVFYVQASGGTFTSTGSPCGTTCKYLEVDATWSVLQWCPTGSGVLSNALSTTPFGSAIGSGYSNTQTMLTGCSSGLAYSVTATYGGKSDWYMPSRGEWDAMYAARASLPIVFAGRGQMASEEASAAWAHEMNGNNGLWTTYTKTGLNAGIGSFPIRAF